MMRRAIPDRTRRWAALGSGAAIIAAALALGGCSASHPQPGHSRPSPSSSKPAPGRSAQASPASAAQASTASGSDRIGTISAQEGTAVAVSDSNGAKLDVTLEQVIDPADGASKYSKPASGKHFVGVKLHLQNQAATTYQNNANNETTIVLTDGKTVDAGYDPLAGCSNFDNGQVKLKAGATATGCVTFQVPKGDTVAEVRYGNTVYPGITAQWHLP
jgi:Domain of unknown function (DUF4352)